MKKIKLTKNKYTIVDDECFDYLNSFNWHYQSRGYAAKKSPRNGGAGNTVLMHRFILGEKNIGKNVVDHINGDKLDNRKKNLRICTFQENQMNKKRHFDSKASYKGICYRKKNKIWESYITIKGKQKYLGSAKTEVEAAVLYNTAATKLFGEYANLNKII